MNITILGGAGTQALGIVDDLVRHEPGARIRLIDVGIDALRERASRFPEAGIEIGVADLTDETSIVEAIADADVVVMSGPTGLCIHATRAALRAGKHYVDLGTFPAETEEQLLLNDAFTAAGRTAVLGVGSAPGITSVMARACIDRLDAVSDIDITIAMRDLTDRGGRVRWPFTADAILDEHTEPARAYLNGELVDLPPRTGREETFPAPIGTVTAMATNHPEPTTLARTFADRGVQNIVFRIALPDDVDHAVTMLNRMGLAARRELRLHDGASVDLRPVVLAALMSTDQSLSEREQQWSATRVVVRGTRDRQTRELTAEMIVAPDPEVNLPAGLVKTATPPAIVAAMLARGEVAETGVLVPEACIDPDPFFRALAARRMEVRVREELVLGGVS